MRKRKKKGSNHKSLFATVSLAVIILILFLVWNPFKKGKREDQVSIPVLSRSEKGALRRYSNTYHLKVAQMKGIEQPLKSKNHYKDREIDFGRRNRLTEITDNKYYEIPLLTNSLPYLQPPAEKFLDLLGKKFYQQLENKGLRKYRFSVTSILRTIEDQKSLRKSNINATPNTSSHYYGRTFDIAQTRFFERGNSNPVYSYRLRNILLRELIKLQEEGKCYVLLEHQTKCIHVTVR